MTMSMGQFAKLYDPDIQGMIVDKTEAPSVAGLIFNEMPATEYVTNIVGLTGLGLTPQQEEGVAVDYSDPVQGYAKAYTQLTFGQGIQITKRLWSYNKHPEAVALGGMLGDSAAYSREKSRIDVLNDGFTVATASGSDALELFSLVHLLKNSTSTEQNELTTTATALSDSSLEEALYTGDITINHSGLKRRPNFRYLVVPPQLKRYALELTGSSGKPDVNTNNINALFPSLEVLSTPLLTSTTACFLLTEKSGHHLKALVHQAPAVRGPKLDFDTENIKYALSYEEVVGWDEWFGTFGWQGA